MTAADPALIGTPTLAAVRTRSSDFANHVRVFELITGHVATVKGGAALFHLGSVSIILEPATPEDQGADGITRLRLASPDFQVRAGQLRRQGAEVLRSGQHEVLASSWTNGLPVEFVSQDDTLEVGSPADASFDHVAVLVADLPLAVGRWRTVVGGAPSFVGPHPLGGSDTARFELGESMIELVSPWRGNPSPMLKRLETSGEGPLALALPAHDLRTTVARLDAANVPLVSQGPHVFVHPRSAAGVLVQLTPRLKH